MLISTIGANLEIFLIWGSGREFWSLSMFALAFGSTAGEFAGLRPRFAAEIVGDQDEQDNQSLLVFATLTASRGAAVRVYTDTVMLAASFGAVGIFVSPKLRGGREKARTATNRITRISRHVYIDLFHCGHCHALQIGRAHV